MPVIRPPLSTYRLQFNPQFRFADARRILGYLHDLGISDLYASPIFRARPESSHGYDVTDPTRLNPELGSDEEFEALAREARGRGMGWLQDIVPNHLAWNADNPMLADLLERGPLSPHRDHFDIFWDHPASWLKGKVLAPFLGRELRECLRKREIVLEYGEAGFSLRYYQARFPLALSTYRSVLPTLTRMRQLLPAGDPGLERYRDILARLPRVPASPNGSRPPAQPDAAPAAGDAVGRFVKEELWRLYGDSPMFRRKIDEKVRRTNTGPGREGSPLDRLLAKQYTLLAFWRVSLEVINYRRFFTINEMIGVKVEKPEVFEHTHSLIARLVKEGIFTGLRVDHIDGLYDPQEYLSRLRAQNRPAYLVVEKILDLREDLPEDWPVQGTTGYEFDNYVNGLFCRPASEGAFDQIYVDFAGMEEPFSRMLYRNKRGIAERWLAGDFDNLAYLVRRTLKEVEGAGIPQASMRDALIEFASLFPVYRTYISPRRCSPADRSLIQDTLERARLRNPELEKALQALKALLLPEGEWGAGTSAGADADAPQRGIREEGLHLLMKIQQITGPLMAKGFEDTTLYQYNRLLSLNAVGGSPTAFGIPLAEFHRFNERRRRAWPHAMNATSTHDTKRGEDVRARINVLTEIPGEWAGFLAELRKSRGVPTAAVPAGGAAGGAEAGSAAATVPDRNDEYLLFQTLVGAFPVDGRVDERFIGRIQQYLIKATREAKRNTSWIEPNLAYEEGLMRFLDRILGRPRGGSGVDAQAMQKPSPQTAQASSSRPRVGASSSRAERGASAKQNRAGQEPRLAVLQEGRRVDAQAAGPVTPFLKIFLPFQRRVAFYGIFNSLSQLLVKLTVPGVPDIYQGTELWDLSLVDPDNRSPVDYGERQAALRQIDEGWKADPERLLAELLAHRRDGRIKMFLLHRGLLARRENPELFLHGDYLPLGVRGAQAERIIAFARRHGERWALTAVPRFLIALVAEGEDPLGERVWTDTEIELPDGAPTRWRDALTGEKLTLRGGRPPYSAAGALPAAAAFRLLPAALLLG
jgi:(1->4)-alpha-D-glucan 1-alpha-D-glucosylmutase